MKYLTGNQVGRGLAGILLSLLLVAAVSLPVWLMDLMSAWIG
jgi:hypothetical protein